MGVRQAAGRNDEIADSTRGRCNARSVCSGLSRIICNPRGAGRDTRTSSMLQRAHAARCRANALVALVLVCFSKLANAQQALVSLSNFQYVTVTSGGGLLQRFPGLTCISASQSRTD